jgi:hypothetical protein
VRKGIPIPILFIFGTVALLACAGDFRMLRRGEIRGPSRIARHLWRMCFALWIAAASFFWGPRARVARLIPEPFIKPALLAIPVLVPLLALLYWTFRVKFRKSFKYAGRSVKAS